MNNYTVLRPIGHMERLEFLHNENIINSRLGMWRFCPVRTWVVRLTLISRSTGPLTKYERKYHIVKHSTWGLRTTTSCTWPRK